MIVQTLLQLFLFLTSSSAVLPLTDTWALPPVGQVSQANEDKIKGDSPASWVGREFIFLEMPRILQHYGYLTIRLHEVKFDASNERNSDLESATESLIYDKFVGDHLKVLSVKGVPESPGEPVEDFDIVFSDVKKNMLLYAHTSHGVVMQIAPTDELDIAKEMWLGKTVWSRSRTLYQYDAVNDVISRVKVPLGEKLRITQIAWGWNPVAPIWIIVKRENGQECYYEIATSRANILATVYDDLTSWPNIFYDHDPRTDYVWPQAVWAKVCNGDIGLGMTYDQVALALGPPQHKNRDIYEGGATQQWAYRNRFVYFSNDKVSAIQDR